MFSSGPQAEERAPMRAAPFVFGHDAFVIRRQEPLDANFEIGKAGPVFGVSLGHLPGPDKWLGHAANIVKAIGRHSLQKLLHIVGAFGLDVLAKDGEAFLRYPHPVPLPAA
jgi:hypothetical protein